MAVSLFNNKGRVEIHSQKVAIYVRWSTDDQGEGTTLDVQLQRCKDYIKSQGWFVNDSLIYIDDGYSGGSLKRPGITQLRKDIMDSKVDCIVIMKLDRLSRSIVDTVKLVLEEWDDIAYIKSVMEPFDTTTQIGKQILTMLAGFAEWERYTIRERTFGGKIQRASEGKNPGFKAPYGYITGEVTGTFEIVKEEADIVRRIYREYRGGLGRSAIAQQFNAEGILFRKGKPWNDSTIAHILKNPLYIGKLIYGRLQRNNKREKRAGEKFWNRNEEPLVIELKEETLRPIITCDEFEAVRKIAEERDVFKDRRTSGKAFTSPHLLSGLLKCKCGHSLTARSKGQNDNYYYYMCRGNKTKGKTFCDCGYIRQDMVDIEVIKAVKAKFLQERNSLYELLSNKYDSRLNELKLALHSVQNELAGLDNEINRIDRGVRKGTLSNVRYEKLINQIEFERSEFAKKEQNLVAEIAELNSHKISPVELEAFAKSLDKWEKLTLDEQKQLLYRWIDHVVVYKAKGGILAKLSIEIHYKTNMQMKKSVG